MVHQQHVTLVITHRLAPGQEQAYEAWLKRIMPEAAGFAGHLGVNVIRPTGSEQVYTILVRFDSIDNLNQWNNSPLRKKYIEEVAPLLLEDDHVDIRPGAEFWFTPPSATTRPPAKWKQFLITLLVIFPSTNLVPWFWSKLLPQLGGTLPGHFLNDATVVALVVFLWMPIATRVFHQWLIRH
ncbi:antibiotic biosynthesis monooxygenase [Serratia plymuthica]|uniref:antibiotic biosynthesis monooxygenase n=1 Tax=Serratia plymuthica TaxID=82996 RepID=UPI0007A0B8F8|nr:antibiotic biosynthesis monooxygenase [Serratia plymuthica]KYQ94987.1 antibiotic biosynthesis monooxygenase [Serratia plymuthica]